MQADQVDRDEAAGIWFEAVVGEVGDRAAVEQWVKRLPPGYRERTAPGDAADDLRAAGDVERRAGEPLDGPAGPFGAPHHLAVRPAAEGDVASFRLRRVGTSAVELTVVLPVLESFGLAVTEAVPFLIAPGAGGGADELHVDDFGLRLSAAASGFEAAAGGARLIEALEAAASGRSDVDGLNRLVTAAGLDWRQVVVLRAYRRYRRQATTPFEDHEIDDSLAAFPEVTAALVRYFEARFAPGAGEGRGDAVEAARAEVLSALGAVPHLRQDQMLRGILGLVDATVRTNWYRNGSGRRPPETLVLKLDSSRVPDLPAPRPYVETFVHGPAVEGIHIRKGPVARGGIRWSDRPSDFRTEVLGLAEAQTKKNAIIVPTGAKGGFVLRSGAAPAPGGAVLAAYRAFIAGLLDVTDTVVGGKVVTPSGVVPADGDDPYLVVAADKGTATFSDEANALSEAYGFWLGDAFASGGSHGYDHKAMGITARGAWVAVRRHFRHLGIDVQTEPIRIAGVGDMSGDVFGNGMLQSRAVKLVAAFDHRHIFVDPDPDPEGSWRERARTAALPRSSWADYDPGAISPGGGVWARDEKEIVLSAKARDSLGLPPGSLRPPELISAILTAPVDLLWFGGIGTFVKAPGEADAEVGDRTNDGVRVTADKVRARVIAEGGNLGVTQRGRIRYSRRGGRINADFIDNAAGVATSDREVNLKILLAVAAEDGRLAPGERDEVLAAARDDVATEVLRQVDHTAAALDRSLSDSARSIDAYEALIERLETVGLVDRRVESLPGSDELAARREAGAGLIRPELAVLLAYAKSDLISELEKSPVVADPALAEGVTAYFPPAVRKVAGDLIPSHRLYPQLAATDVAGELVDHLGIVWAHETAAELGRPLAEVAGAFWAARQVVGAGRLWAELDQAAGALADTPGDGLDADAEAVLHGQVVDAVAALARCYLRRRGAIVPSALIEEDLPLAGDASLPATLATGSGAGRPAGGPAGRGVEPERLARFAAAGRRASLGEVAPVARATSRPVADAAAALTAFDGLPAVRRLRDLLARAEPDGRWSAWQARAVADDLCDLRARAAVSALADGTGDPGGLLARWADSRAGALGQAGAVLARVQPGQPDALTAASLALRILASR